MNSRDVPQQKLDLLLSAKTAFRIDQKSKTWEEKVAAIARMNTASKLARDAMRQALVREANQT
jgi:hypothetical protein